GRLDVVLDGRAERDVERHRATGQADGRAVLGDLGVPAVRVHAAQRDGEHTGRALVARVLELRLVELERQLEVDAGVVGHLPQALEVLVDLGGDRRQGQILR